MQLAAFITSITHQQKVPSSIKASASRMKMLQSRYMGNGHEYTFCYTAVYIVLEASVQYQAPNAVMPKAQLGKEDNPGEPPPSPPFCPGTLIPFLERVPREGYKPQQGMITRLRIPSLQANHSRSPVPPTSLCLVLRTHI